MRLFLLLFFCLTFIGAKAQVVFQPISSSVYEYLDEMAGEGYIQINTAVKPFSRKYIADRLKEIEKESSKLNERQKKELAFYLKDFNKELLPGKDWDRRRDLFYYKDSIFQITVNPILGGRVILNNNGSAWHRWNGGEIYGRLGKHFGFAASLRDNGISEDIYGNEYLQRSQGGNYKINQGQEESRIDFSEMRGGLTYGWNWGAVSIMKDNFVWGNNYNGSNIFSGRQPSFAYLSLKANPVKWFDFNYVHGWLVSEELDSAGIYFVNGVRRRTFEQKYLAANMFTFSPWKKLNLTFGNSVIYADDGLEPGFLIPFFFFKSVDHTYNGAGSNDLGQNAQMYFDVSSRQLNKLHLYASVFFDELSISNALDSENHTNIMSMKFGGRVINPVPNTSLFFEYTRTNPWTYRHQIVNTTFESNEFNLGHYLGDNAEEIYLAASVKPFRGWQFFLGYTQAVKGEEIETKVTNGIPAVRGLDFIEKVAWYSKSISFRTTWEVVNDGWWYFEVISGDTQGYVSRYTPQLFQGQTTSIITGLNFGF